MAARFEIILNGERHCVSGIDDDGVLSVSVNYAKRGKENGKYQFHISGLARFPTSQEKPQHANWPAPPIGIGDEITIRVLEPGRFDSPQNMIESPSASLSDPVFGCLDYNVNAWDGDLEFGCPPFTNCHVHLVSDPDGPSDSQRQRFQELLARHEGIWPTIAEALVRCHTEIETVDQLTARILPRIGIDMGSDDGDIGLSYSVDGDPEFRMYFVTVRNWEVAEVCTVD